MYPLALLIGHHNKRPYASFEVMEMSMKSKDPQINDPIRVSMCIRKIQMGDVTIMFSKLCAPVKIIVME